MKMLDMNDADFVEQFREALGLKPGEMVQFATPQFERTDGITPVASVDSWAALRNQSVATLEALGCCRWDEPDKDGRTLMLFPREWYWKIPADYELECIDGTTEAFRTGKTDDDYRFGCLAYGVRVRESQP